MPVIVSTNRTMSRATAVLFLRYCTCERTWNQRVSTMPGTTAMSSTSPLRQSSSTSETAVSTIASTPVASVVTPPSRSSRNDSTSEVCREMIRPDVYCSWNSRLSSCVCRKTRRRRSSSIVWLTRAEARTVAAVSTPPRSAATRYVPEASTSGRASPCPQRGQRTVDAVRDERRPGDGGELRADDERGGPPRGPPDRVDQRREQDEGPAAQQA